MDPAEVAMAVAMAEHERDRRSVFGVLVVGQVVGGRRWRSPGPPVASHCPREPRHATTRVSPGG